MIPSNSQRSEVAFILTHLLDRYTQVPAKKSRSGMRPEGTVTCFMYTYSEEVRPMDISVDKELMCTRTA